MYYLSMVAYYVFFNAFKVAYILSLLVTASFYMFLLSKSMENWQGFGAFVCEEKARRRNNLVMCLLQFQHHHHHHHHHHVVSNASLIL
ncbi:hypothetical protein OWV82_019551 [Melia azedarach]|uniref:Uncharacterized protein n=1 Tax=Melia azedarach TaxID=155640 RepID=A0ACC1X541_MELAZ|nr:hypothetical protein OWV82_019551 [Melia azedarach]